MDWHHPVDERKHMSVETNIDVVQQTYDAFGRGDIPALLSLLSDDVEWALPDPP
jgi:ketosteroid isomerase-like protein